MTPCIFSFTCDFLNKFQQLFAHLRTLANSLLFRVELFASSHHIRQSQTFSSFRRHLKTRYFQSAYAAPYCVPIMCSVCPPYLAPNRECITGVVCKIYKKAQLSLTNPRDAKACQNCSNSTCLQRCRWQYWPIFMRLTAIASEIREIPRNSLKIQTYRVEGYPRSSILVPIESPYVTCYWSLIVTLAYLLPFSRYSRLKIENCWFY